MRNTWLRSFTKQLGLLIKFKAARGRQLRETAALPRVGVVSAPPVDMPPAFESREYSLFVQDFDTLFYLFGSFFSIQIWLGG